MEKLVDADARIIRRINRLPLERRLPEASRIIRDIEESHFGDQPTLNEELIKRDMAFLTRLRGTVSRAEEKLGTK